MAENSVNSMVIPDEILHGSREDIAKFATNVPGMQPAAATNAPSAPVPPPKNASVIEDLLLFGSVKYDANILGMRFTVRTLTIEEKEEAYGAVANLSPTSFVHFSKLRDELLARAVEKVNGMNLLSYYKGDTLEGLSDAEKKVRVVKKMHGPLVDKLYELYNILEEKASKALDAVNFDDIKNS